MKISEVCKLNGMLTLLEDFGNPISDIDELNEYKIGGDETRTETFRKLLKHAIDDNIMICYEEETSIPATHWVWNPDVVVEFTTRSIRLVDPLGYDANLEIDDYWKFT